MPDDTLNQNPPQPRPEDDQPLADTTNNPPPISHFSLPNLSSGVSTTSAEVQPQQPSQSIASENPSEELSNSPNGKKYSTKNIIVVAVLVAGTFLTSTFYFAKTNTIQNVSKAAKPPVSPGLSNPTTTLAQKTGFGALLQNSSSAPSVSQTGASSLPTAIDSKTQTSSAPHPSYTSVSITASANTFNPSTITVFKDQIVTLNITSVDKTYDVFIEKLNLSRAIPQGQVKSIQFQATLPGQYQFYCKDNCPGATQAKGILIIQ